MTEEDHRPQLGSADAFFLPSLTPDTGTLVEVGDVPAEARASFDLDRQARVFADAYHSLCES